MKKIARHSCLLALSLFFCGICYAKLSNQQINLLFENDDVQIFNLNSKKVKKSTLSVQEGYDKNQGKKIVQYDKNGLLINYYSTSLMAFKLKNQNMMITTLMRSEDFQWQRKQTIGTYQLDNSFYELKGDQIKITRLPSYSVNKKRVIVQENNPIREKNELIVNFKYYEPEADKKLNIIEYHFDALERLKSFNFSSVDDNDSNYTSVIKTKFEYDGLNRLIQSHTSISYQSQRGIEESHELSNVTYSEFDHYGNWLTKTVMINGDPIVYKRSIEYW